MDRILIKKRLNEEEQPNIKQNSKYKNMKINETVTNIHGMKFYNKGGYCLCILNEGKLWK